MGGDFRASGQREEAANVTAPNSGPSGLRTRSPRRAGTSIVGGDQLAAGAFVGSEWKPGLVRFRGVRAFGLGDDAVPTDYFIKLA